MLVNRKRDHRRSGFPRAAQFMSEVAWAPDGLTIVAIASSFDAAERKAAKAG
jgi:hypothetical protein